METSARLCHPSLAYAASGGWARARVASAGWARARVASRGWARARVASGGWARARVAARGGRPLAGARRALSVLVRGDALHAVVALLPRSERRRAARHAPRRAPRAPAARRAWRSPVLPSPCVSPCECVSVKVLQEVKECMVGGVRDNDLP